MADPGREKPWNTNLANHNFERLTSILNPQVGSTGVASARATGRTSWPNQVARNPGT
jgi:hypothetical protein